MPPFRFSFPCRVGRAAWQCWPLFAALHPQSTPIWASFAFSRKQTFVEKPKDNDNSCDQSRHNERVEKHLLPANAIHGKRRRLSASMAERDALPWDDAPQYLIRDRDGIYGTLVTRRLRAMGIRDKPTPPASPWQNGFAERLIGSIRRECVDHLVVLGEAHLRRILRFYARYYNEIRTHWSLAKDAPVSRPIQRTGSIRSHPILGRLHHHYVRV